MQKNHPVAPRLHTKKNSDLQPSPSKRPHQSAPESPKQRPLSKVLRSKNQVQIRKRVFTSPQNPLETSMEHQSPSTTPKIPRTNSQAQFSSPQSSPVEDYSDAETVKHSDFKLVRFQNIAAITTEENQNLREQNKYLLAQLRKMKKREEKVRKLFQKAKQYKGLLEQTRDQINITNQQKQVYKQCVNDLMQISSYDIPVLQNKVKQVNSVSEINSLSVVVQQNWRPGKENQKHRPEVAPRQLGSYQNEYETIKEETEDQISIRTSQRERQNFPENS